MMCAVYNKVNRLREARLFFDSINSVLVLPEFVKSEVARLYHKLLSIHESQGLSTERAVSALVYYVCTRDGYHLSIKDISRLTGVNKYSLFRTYKTMTRKLGLRNRLIINPSSIVNRYADNLRVSFKTISEAIRVLKQLEEAGLTNDPTVTAGTVVYLTANKNNERVSINKVCREFKISESAISNLKKKLEGIT